MSIKTLYKYLHQIKPASFFIVAAVFMELLLNIVTPPLQAPDEFSHFYRAYQISEGHFFPEKTDQRLGGKMPRGVVDFSDQYRNSAYIMQYTIDYGEIANSYKIRLNENDRVFQDFANTSYYSPVSYLPQATILFVLKKFTDRVGWLYYGGRVFTFFVWLLCMFVVIRTIPVFKWLITFLLLLPMNLYMANSWSADTVTNILSFLFIGLVFKHVFVTEKLTKKHLFILSVLIGLLVLAKVVYIGLVILLLIIPSEKFASKASRIFNLTAILLLSFLLMFLWTKSIMQFYIPIKAYNHNYRDVASLSPCGDYYAQQAYILGHGLYFFKVIFRSLFMHPWTYLSGYIGVFGNGDIGMPKWMYFASYAGILFVACSEKNNFSFNGFQKVGIFIAALTACALLLLSQHLIWDCVGEGIVDLLQGRYLIPLFPLLFILFNNNIGVLKRNISVLIVLFVLFLNVSGCVFIYNRYFVGAPLRKKEFYCDTEELDVYGAFKTTDYDVFLQNPNCRTNREHRSGKFSALISPESPYCFTYHFAKVHPGDIVEVEVWQKGDGARIVVSGEQKNCGEVYFAGSYKSYTDKLGWQRIKNVYQVKPKCDSLKMAMYIWNPGKTHIYVDDLKFTITRFKK